MPRSYSSTYSPPSHSEMGACCCSCMRRRLGFRLRLNNGWVVELLKLMLAVSVGFTARTIVDLSGSHGPGHGGDCSACEDAANTPQDILKNPESVQTQLREPYQPRTMYDVIRYEYFNSTYMLSNMDSNPKIALLGHQKSDVHDIVHQTMSLFNSLQSKTWKVNRLLNGYRRIDPLRGEEYFLDLEILQPETKDARGTPHSQTHRFSLVKPFTVPQLLQDELLSSNKMIHFIVTVSGAVTERFEMFLRNFEDVCIKNNENVYLLVVLFQKKDGVEGSRAGAIKNLVDLLHKKYRRAHIRLIQTSKEFNRAFGLDLGLKQLPPNTLAFICDSDISFTRDFLNRCRHNTVMNKQVYYPIVFGQYNPAIVKGFSPKKKSKDLMDINKHTGHWIHYGYGMACMYVGDYRTAGGYGQSRHGWGGEDVDLYIKHVRQKISIFRAVEPGLVHRYHDRHCSPNLPEDQYRMCVDSSAETYGSNSQLAKKLAAMDLKQNQAHTTTASLLH